MKLNVLHKSTVNNSLYEGFGNYLRTGILSGAALLGAGSSMAADAPNPFNTNRPILNAPDEFEGINGEKYRKLLGKTNKYNSNYDIGDIHKDKELFEKCRNELAVKFPKIIDTDIKIWYKVCEEFFNNVVAKEVNKTGLPVNPTNLIAVYVIGADGINDLLKKYKKDWFQHLPRETQDFIKLYVGNRK